MTIPRYAEGGKYDKLIKMRMSRFAVSFLLLAFCLVSQSLLAKDPIAQSIVKAQTFSKNKNYNQAIEVYTQTIQKTTKKKARSDLYFKRGKLYHKLGNLAQALDDYTQVLKFKPNNPDLLFFRGCLYLQRTQYKQAALDFKSVIGIDVNYRLGQVYLLLADLYSENKEYSKAVVEYTNYIVTHPNHAYSYYNRANCYYRLQDLNNAVDDYTKVISLDANYQKGLVYYYRGSIYYQLKKAKEAIIDFSKAIDLNPYHGAFYNDRGVVYLRLKEYRLAENDYLKAIEYAVEGEVKDTAEKNLALLEEQFLGGNPKEVVILDYLDKEWVNHMEEIRKMVSQEKYFLAQEHIKVSQGIVKKMQEVQEHNVFAQESKLRLEAMQKFSLAYANLIKILMSLSNSKDLESNSALAIRELVFVTKEHLKEAGETFVDDKEMQQLCFSLIETLNSF